MDSEILENLSKAITEYKPKEAEKWAKKVVEEGIDPLQALDVLTVSIREVGNAFGRRELFLPELVGAAEALQAATPVLEGELKNRNVERKSHGNVIIGTVFGDIHNIGKSMVSTLLTADGFHVIDLGVNITADAFIQAVSEQNPDILAMSSLLTITAPEQAKVINALKEKGLRGKVKIMVGGGAITEKFADGIGADGYDPTAPGAVTLARKLLGMEKEEKHVEGI